MESYWSEYHRQYAYYQMDKGHLTGEKCAQRCKMISWLKACAITEDMAGVGGLHRSDGPVTSCE